MRKSFSPSFILFSPPYYLSNGLDDLSTSLVVGTCSPLIHILDKCILFPLRSHYTRMLLSLPLYNLHILHGRIGSGSNLQLIPSYNKYILPLFPLLKNKKSRLLTLFSFYPLPSNSGCKSQSIRYSTNLCMSPFKFRYISANLHIIQHTLIFSPSVSCG